MSRRIIDLSLEIYPDYPDHPLGVKTEMGVFASHRKDGFQTTRMTFSSHCGTHMDAPFHFLPGAATIDRIDLRKCVGPACVLDLTKCGLKKDIGVAHLRPYAELIRPGGRILLRTDVSRLFGRPEYYTDFPGVSLELANWLADRGISLIGVESYAIHSTDYTAVHKVLLEKGIVIVEGLAHLDELKQNSFQFIALPLKLRGGDGSPVRAVAIEDD